MLGQGSKLGLLHVIWDVGLPHSKATRGLVSAQLSGLIFCPSPSSGSMTLPWTFALFLYLEKSSECLDLSCYLGLP